MYHSSCIREGKLFIIKKDKDYGSNNSYFIGKIKKIRNDCIYYEIIHQLDKNDNDSYHLGNNGYYMKTEYFNKITRIITKSEAMVEIL